MSFTIYLHKDFIQVPFSITGLHAPCPVLLDLACELRTKSMPPVPNRFIAHIDTTLMQKVFYISQRKWKPHIQHNCKLDNLRASFEIAERYYSGHGWIANIQRAPWQGGLFWQCLKYTLAKWPAEVNQEISLMYGMVRGLSRKRPP